MGTKEREVNRSSIIQVQLVLWSIRCLYKLFIKVTWLQV